MAKQRTSIIWSLPLNEFKELVLKCKTQVEVLAAFGLQAKGSNPRTLKRRLVEDCIDTSHFTTHKENLENFRKKMSLEEILVEGSNYNRCRLKNRLIDNQILPNTCSECKIHANWNGKDLVLQLDHINGIHDDNRLSNLRLLCPNCHSQTETFAGKRRRGHVSKHKICPKCNGFIASPRATLCRSCTNSSKKGQAVYRQSKINWPEKDELLKLVSDIGCLAASKKLGVSDTAVRNHIQKYCR